MTAVALMYVDDAIRMLTERGVEVKNYRQRELLIVDGPVIKGRIPIDRGTVELALLMPWIGGAS